MTIGIYKIENKINGLVYIGKSVDIEKRWRKHISELNNNVHINTYLQNSWKKYGSEYFSFEIIKECKPEQLNDLEKFYIQFYDSMNNGYNLTEGGEGCFGRTVSEKTKAKISEALKGEKNGMYGKHHSEESKRKISENSPKYWSGKKLSEEHKKNISESKKGSIPWMKGKKHTEESKKKMSEAHKGNNYRKKYTLWDPAKCDYNKNKMFRNKRDSTSPCRCFRIKYNGKKLPIGTHMDFISCEIIHDLIFDACEK